jgi:hypothetical protein
MLGAEQREWLLEDLATTKARWNILAQQTAFAPLNNAAAGAPPRFTAGADNREGYVAERQAIIDWTVEHQTPNLVVLTGDSHRNWVRDIPRHYTSLDNPIGTEFLGTSVSTGSDPDPVELEFGDSRNPHLHFRNNNRGYARCTLTPDTWTTEYRVVDTVEQPASPCRTLATFDVPRGERNPGRSPGEHLERDCLRRPGVCDPLERPHLGEPARHELAERAVALGVRRAHPREDEGVGVALGVGIDVDAADHAAIRWVEDGVGEAGARREVAGVALEVRTVLVQRHRARPATVRVARRRPDVLDRGRPRLVVVLVVLGAERLEQELIRDESEWRLEGVGDEGHVRRSRGPPAA